MNMEGGLYVLAIESPWWTTDYGGLYVLNMESPWENQVTSKQLLQMLREKGEKGKGGRAVGGKGKKDA